MVFENLKIGTVSSEQKIFESKSLGHNLSRHVHSWCQLLDINSKMNFKSSHPITHFKGNFTVPLGERNRYCCRNCTSTCTRLDDIFISFFHSWIRLHNLHLGQQGLVLLGTSIVFLPLCSIVQADNGGRGQGVPGLLVEIGGEDQRSAGGCGKNCPRVGPG